MNKKHYEILKTGVNVWNKWREENKNLHPDLTNANLRGADLTNANLTKANLRGADLTSAKLYRADLTYAKLTKAKLRGAKLRGANLYRAKLTYAKLNNANLITADLRNANLSKADLSKADLRYTNFINTILIYTNFKNSDLKRTIFGLTDLSTCKGLDSVRVSGECVIDFQTLINSKNKIPKNFLFKIGLPENYIDYLPDFYDETPLRLFPVFLSHSSGDKTFANKLYDALTVQKVRVWYDVHKLKPGDDILDSIDKGITTFDKMILVCSKDSLNSWWVEEELERIFEKERRFRKEHGKKFKLLIPITIDDSIFKSKEAISRSIRKRSIGDFQEWGDEEKFDKALNDLIAALNVDRGGNDPISFL